MMANLTGLPSGASRISKWDWLINQSNYQCTVSADWHRHELCGESGGDRRHFNVCRDRLVRLHVESIELCTLGRPEVVQSFQIIQKMIENELMKSNWPTLVRNCGWNDSTMLVRTKTPFGSKLRSLLILHPAPPSPVNGSSMLATERDPSPDARQPSASLVNSPWKIDWLINYQSNVLAR